MRIREGPADASITGSENTGKKSEENGSESEDGGSEDGGPKAGEELRRNGEAGRDEGGVSSSAISIISAPAGGINFFRD